MGSLSEIVNDAIYMFYAPRERFTSKKLLDLYNRYRRWDQAVPAHLRLTQTSTPQVIYLQYVFVPSRLGLPIALDVEEERDAGTRLPRRISRG